MSEQNEMKFWTPPTATIDLDIEGLMGMKVVHINSYGEKVVCVVAGVDPYIGCSLVDENDPERMIQCLHGPFDPSRRAHYLQSEKWRVEYPHDYRNFVTLLKAAKTSGEFNVMDYIELQREAYGGDGGFGSGSCPFGV